MTDRYFDLNFILLNLFKTNEENKAVLTALFQSCNLQEKPEVDRTIDLKQSTDYSFLSQNELIKMFNKKIFNKLNSTELLHLFQEYHNRIMKDNNYEVSRNVTIQNYTHSPSFGYITNNGDALYVNESVLNKYLNTPMEENNYNSSNIGKVMTFILSHESTHVVQYERMIDIALGNQLNEEQAFSGAINLLNNANFYIAQGIMDNTFINYFHDSYNYKYNEHEANFTATKHILENFANEKGQKNYKQFASEMMLLGLRFRPADTKYERETQIRQRIINMERVITKNVEYFKQHSFKGVISTDMLNFIENFIAVDEKGNSKLREKLDKELHIMVDTYIKAQSKLNNNSNNNTNYLQDIPEFQ